MSCGTVISRWAMWCVMAAVVVLLAACGGGGGGNDRGGNNAPVAVAGASSSGTVCVVVTLDGSASYDADGDELAFSWSITSRPAQSNANLTGTNPARPSFTADKPGTYTLRLLVSDGRSESAPSTVTYTGVLGPDIPVANAGSAQTVTIDSTVTLDGSASEDSDYLPVCLRQTLNYNWALTSMPAGSAAALSSATAVNPTFTADKEGTYVATLTVSNAYFASTPTTVVITAVGAYPPQIVLGQSEPLSGTVQLSLTSTALGNVTWYVDSKLLGTGAKTNGNALSWDTTGSYNGTHLVVAHIQTGVNTYDEVRRTVTVSNSPVKLFAGVSGTSGAINVDVYASSIFGITSVSATLDGTNAGTLTAPNACSYRLSDCSTNDIYRFVVNATAAKSGNHTVVITGEDAAANTQQLVVPVPISNPPVVNFTPVDGALVNGTLHVSGTAVTDKSSIVTVTASLGDVVFLRTTDPNFSGSYNVTGMAPGSYALTLQASDDASGITAITRTVVVTSDSGLVYTPLFNLPTKGQLLAAEGSKLLYLAGDGSAWLRDMSTAVEVRLAAPFWLNYFWSWQISGGRAYLNYSGSECLSNCVYQFQSDGRMLNLSNSNPYSATTLSTTGRTYDSGPVARAGFVIWFNGNADAPGYTLYDVARGIYAKITPPGGFWLNEGGATDFYVRNGVVYFFYSAGSGSSGDVALLRWSSDTNATIVIANSSERISDIQTDGFRVGWSPFLAGSMLVQPVDGGQTTTFPAGGLLRDGVLAWVEGNASANSRALKADTAGGTVTLSTLSSATLYDNMGGYVIYGEQGKLYSWNSATGRTTLRLETMPGQVMVSGGAMVFTVGTAVYRVGLN